MLKPFNLILVVLIIYLIAFVWPWKPSELPGTTCSAVVVTENAPFYRFNGLTGDYLQIRRTVLFQTNPIEVNRMARNNWPEIAVLDATEATNGDDSYKKVNLIGNQTINGKNYRILTPHRAMEFDLYLNGQPVTEFPEGGEAFLPNGYDAAYRTLVFAVHLDANSQPITMRAKNHHGDPGTFYIVDIYQHEGEIRVGKVVPEPIFTCAGRSDQNPDAQTLVHPTQSPSIDKKELQLEWFVFEKGNFGWIGHCKPAVYLYPEKPLMVNVKVKPKGYLTYVDPPYDVEKGWTVLANPDGKLALVNQLTSELVNRKTQKPINLLTNQQTNFYEYLYYESSIPDSEIRIPNEGFVVAFDELESLYRQLLPKLGLNEKEKIDFIEYWQKALPYSPFYFVGVLDQQFKDRVEPLTVVPNPDTQIRFGLYFKALDSKITVNEPVISTPERKGFTLVEWGGMVKLNNGHSFTCSM